MKYVDALDTEVIVIVCVIVSVPVVACALVAAANACVSTTAANVIDVGTVGDESAFDVASDEVGC